MNFLKNNIFQQKKLSLFWLLLHAGLFLLFGISCLLGAKYSISTSLFGILPESSSIKTVGDADNKLNAVTGRTFTVLCASENFSDAKKAAAKVYNSLNKDKAFDSLELYIDTKVVQNLSDLIYEYRYNYLDSQTVNQLNTVSGPQDFAQNALARAFSAFTVTSLDNLETDPFLLTEHSMQQFLNKAVSSGTAMTLKDNVLAAQYKNKWYVMVRGTLSKEGSAITNKNSGIKKIENQTALIGAAQQNVSFVFSGIPFHSYESSSSAQNEIFIISTISIILIILLFLYVFRTPLPVIISICSVAIAALTAFITTLLIFKNINILTFVFGTTLIGMCLDYSIHFFVHWKNAHLISPEGEITKSIFKGLSLSLLSTVICYALLLLAPFTLLQEVAVFSGTGIISSYLTTICLLPLLIKPKKAVKEKKIKSFSKNRIVGISSVFKIPAFIIIIIVFSGILFANKGKCKINNNISNLYKMSATMQKNEITAAKVLNYGSVGWYYIVSGNTPEEVLSNEKKLTVKLDQEITDKNLGSYLAMTQYVPTVEDQKKSYKAFERLLPLAEEQYKAFGMPVSQFKNLKTSYIHAADNYILPGTKLPDFLNSLLSSIWIGKVDNHYYSAVIPLHAHNEKLFKQIADEMPNCFFMNKISDISSRLDKLTTVMLLLLAAAYIIIIFMLKFFYSLKNLLRIAVIPLLIILNTLAVLAACNIPLSFFTVTGIILVFGLGLDYIIYITDSQDKKKSKEKISSKVKTTNTAVLLSFLTTALSFGALAFSTFIPVHIFGLTIFTGLLTAFVCAELSTL